MHGGVIQGTKAALCCLRADVTASLNKGQGITGWFGGCLSTHTTHSHSAQCSAKMTGKVQKAKDQFQN